MYTCTEQHILLIQNDCFSVLILSIEDQVVIYSLKTFNKSRLSLLSRVLSRSALHFTISLSAPQARSHYSHRSGHDNSSATAATALCLRSQGSNQIYPDSQHQFQNIRYNIPPCITLCMQMSTSKDDLKQVFVECKKKLC